MTTGRELRSKRRADEITIKAVTTHMGISRQTLYLIERLAEVPPERVTQYLEALDVIKASRDVLEQSA